MNERLQQTLQHACGISVILIGIAGAAAFLLAVGCCTSAFAQKKKAVEPLLLDIPLYLLMFDKEVVEV